ncbi:MAG TPA: hypothetical protein VM223_06685 [Planctomycetota bacterium]|nr:hypothetical protein [Planctomycetota bacterium]
MVQAPTSLLACVCLGAAIQVGGWCAAAAPLEEAAARNAALAAIRDYGGFVKLDEDGKVFQVNLVYDENELVGDRKECPGTSDDILEYLPSLPEIKELLVHESQATDRALSYIGKLENLETLMMWDAEVSDDGIAHLARLRNLRSIFTGGAPLTDRSLTVISQFKQLRDASLSGNKFTDAGLANLEDLTQLEILWLGSPDNNITDAGLVHLGSLTNLRELELQRINVSEGGLRKLQNLKNLRRIVLNPELTPEAIDRLSDVFPLLKEQAARDAAYLAAQRRWLQELEQPSYKLDVGQVLTYVVSSSSRRIASKEEEPRANAGKREIWVVGRNADGSLRLLARTGSHAVREDGTSEDENVSLAAFNLYPDGRTDFGPYWSLYTGAKECFIQLRPKEGPASFWEVCDEEAGRTIRYGFLGNKMAYPMQYCTFSLSAIDYYKAEIGKVHFNITNGVVSKIETSFLQTRDLLQSGMRTVELEKIATIEPALLAELSKDGETYVKVLRSYKDVIWHLRERPDAVDDALSEAEEILASAEREVTHPMIKEQLKKDLAQHEKERSYLAKRAKAEGALINHPSPRWEAEDFDGRKCSLGDYRGKVTILCFWESHGGWRVRLMKDLVTRYAGTAAVVLGMNTDRFPVEARYAIKSLGLTNRNLHAAEISGKYGTGGYVGQVIIDQGGIVRYIQSGYSLGVRDEIAGSVDELLAAEPGGKPEPQPE